MKKVGCIPEYWSELHSNLATDYNDVHFLSKCNTSVQLQEISKYYLPPKHTDNGTNLYIGPCNQLGITASVIQSDVH